MGSLLMKKQGAIFHVFVCNIQSHVQRHSSKSQSNFYSQLLTHSYNQCTCLNDLSPTSQFSIASLLGISMGVAWKQCNSSGDTFFSDFSRSNSGLRHLPMCSPWISGWDLRNSVLGLNLKVRDCKFLSFLNGKTLLLLLKEHFVWRDLDLRDNLFNGL